MATVAADEIEDSHLSNVHDAPVSVHPLKTLTPLQQERINELRKIVDSWNLAEPEKKFCDDMCLFRLDS